MNLREDAKWLRELIELDDGSTPSVGGLMTSIAELDRDPGIAELDWSRLPVQEMASRGWFRHLEDRGWSTSQQARDFLRNCPPSGTLAAFFHRGKYVRSNRQLDPVSLLAWTTRIAMLASECATLPECSLEAITPKFLETVARLSPLTDGPVLARDLLNGRGVSVVIEPHLPRTYVDGAAMIVGGRPVIALSLRHDRVDHFWFCLMHELAHIVLHCGQNHEMHFFDDMDADNNLADVEHEADDFARETLIPGKSWGSSAARLLPTREAADLLAHDLGVHPAVVAGRIRHERGNYALLSDLVGQGEVRRLFPEVKWS